MFTLGFKIALLVIAVLAAITIFASGAAIERSVNRGFLPKFFLRLVPAMIILARTIAVALIILGGVEGAIQAGWLPPEWLHRYAWAGVLVFMGGFLLLVTLRRRPTE